LLIDMFLMVVKVRTDKNIRYVACVVLTGAFLTPLQFDTPNQERSLTPSRLPASAQPIHNQPCRLMEAIHETACSGRLGTQGVPSGPLDKFGNAQPIHKPTWQGVRTQDWP
jgi:hypothetical protein